MANHKSSAKRARQDIKKNARNREYISSVRTAVKKFYAALEEGKDAETLASLLKATQSLISKAASKGLYHKNNAARRISRLTKAMVNNKPQSAAKPKKAKKKVVKKKTTKKKTASKKKATKKKTTKKK